MKKQEDDSGRTRSELRLARPFSLEEKRALRGSTFSRRCFDDFDLTDADLRDTLFQDVSLRGADLSGADLRGAVFLRCDMRGVRLVHTIFGQNRFDGSCLLGCIGIGAPQRRHIQSLGGLFLTRLIGGAGRSDADPPEY